MTLAVLMNHRDLLDPVDLLHQLYQSLPVDHLDLSDPVVLYFLQVLVLPLVLRVQFLHWDQVDLFHLLVHLVQELLQSLEDPYLLPVRQYRVNLVVLLDPLRPLDLLFRLDPADH